MPKVPLFSVIIPTHNRAELLRISIQSVLDQTCQNWELLIVDDGSEDETTSVVKEFSDDRIHYFYQQKSERSVTRNTGIQQAQGSYICFLDDDDYYLPDFLRGFADYLESNDFPMLILRTGFLRKKEGKLFPATNYDPFIHTNPLRFAAFYMCSVASLCIPVTLLQQEQFADHLYYWEDTHLILRLLLKVDLIQLPTHQYVYVQHDNMSSRFFYLDPGFSTRLENNLGAMHDFFQHYGIHVGNNLPPWTERFLVVEKYLDHAIACIPFRGRVASIQLVWISLRYYCFRPRIVRKYASWVKRMFWY